MNSKQRLEIVRYFLICSVCFRVKNILASVTEDRNEDVFKFECFLQQPVLLLLQLQLPPRPLQSLLEMIHLHIGFLYLPPQLLQHLEVWPDAVQRLQPAALPGHLGLQAAHLGRDGPGLLLQPLITSLASRFLASSLSHVGRGQKNRSVRFSKRQSPEPPLNINIF